MATTINPPAQPPSATLQNGSSQAGKTASGGQHSVRARLSSLLDSNMDRKAVLYPMLLDTFSTAMLDVSSLNAFGVFSATQTGNLINLFSSAIGPDPPSCGIESGRLLLTGVSLALFLVVVFLFGRVSLHYGARYRPVLLSSVLVQAIALLVAAILLRVGVFGDRHMIRQDNRQDRDLAPLCLITLAAALQISQARLAGLLEIPTAMVTFAFVDELSHPELFARKLRPRGDEAIWSRNARLAFLLAFISGLPIAAVINRYAGLAIVAFIGFAFRTITLITFLTLPGLPRQNPA